MIDRDTFVFIKNSVIIRFARDQTPFARGTKWTRPAGHVTFVFDVKTQRLVISTDVITLAV